MLNKTMFKTVQRLFLQLHPGTLAAELARARIDFENPKTDWLHKFSSGGVGVYIQLPPTCEAQRRANPAVTR